MATLNLPLAGADEKLRQFVTPIKIGVVGTGYISRHFFWALEQQQNFSVARVLTRRAINSCHDYPDPTLLTDSIDDVLEQSDLLFECSGDAVHATNVIAKAVERGIAVVTLNSEFHVTAGSYFVGKGLITEAEGDQPGCLAILREDARAQGFTPIVYGNMKAFLNHNPTLDEMKLWEKRSGMRLPMVVSATNGTKLQIEQALVANAFGAGIAVPGLIGVRTNDVKIAAEVLAKHAKSAGEAISDYMLAIENPHGVFLVAEHDSKQRDSLRHLKMGGGPFYVLQRLYVLAHLDVIKTIKRVILGGGILLDNSSRPRLSVASIASDNIPAGMHIEHGVGSFLVRGSAVWIADNLGHLPICLLNNAVTKRRISAGDILMLDDVDLPESLALHAWQETEKHCGKLSTREL